MKLGLLLTFIVLTGYSAVNADGENRKTPAKISYEPLSAEARATGQLAKYASADRTDVRLDLGLLGLRMRAPVRAEAYDAVPIEYTLEGDPGPDARVAIEATAFEDESRRAGRHLYDLAVPGNMKLKIEYLGSRTGIFDPSRVMRLTATSRHETFPPYRLEPFVRSGTVKRGNYLFFQFRITNVGDTILDPEGFGGWMAIPQAFLIKPDGTREHRATTINQFERHLGYLYPGESFEQWVAFWSPGVDPMHVRTLPVGKYIVQYQAAARWNTEYNWIVNMWAGKPWMGLEVPIEVAEEPADTPVEPTEVVLDGGETDRMTRYVHSLEEFMTSLRVFEKGELATPQTGTIHVQVAPWTHHVVIKLIGNTPGRIRTVAVPIEIASDSLTIRPNPDNPFTVQRDGESQPAFCTQMMPAMRATTQLGPNPDRHLRDRLREAMDCGVNVICSTGGDWHIPEVFNGDGFFGDVHAETFKHYYDVIVPEARVPVFGWGLFPNKTPNALGLGSHYWGRKFDVPFTPLVYTYASSHELDVAHPDFPKLYAGAILFNHQRWGHLWYNTADGDVLIDVEDSWGWHRDDINTRYTLGEHALRRFHDWLRHKYVSINAVNQAWGTGFKDFGEIDPQKDQGNEGKAYGVDLTRIAPVYNRPDHPFHDWTAATEDWDVFRTELRCDIYEEIHRHVREVIPAAQINLRTEGAIIPVPVDADETNPHLRHLRYSQRRQALVAEVLARRKVFKYHSDYTTIPYAPSEWRDLLRRLREQGMRGNYLPQFCTARDMLLNDHYGRDYRINYNLPSAKPAAMMHVLQAAYPVWKAMHEEGHCPGVLWEDYMCDGFVSETQKRELKLFRKGLSERDLLDASER